MAKVKYAKRKKPEEKLATMTLFFRGVPKSLKQHFQAWCSLRGLTMKEVFLSMIREKIKITDMKPTLPEDM